MQQCPHDASYETPEPHDPFVLRKALVLLAAVPAATFSFFWDSLFVGMSLYFFLVTIADLLSHYVLASRPSQNVDPEKLLFFQHVTPEQFDAYFETQVWIRCTSLGIAFVVGALALCLVPHYTLKIFCGAYILSTLIGSLRVWLFLEISTPRMFYRDDRYYVPNCGPRLGHITLGQWALDISNGRLPKGPVDI